MDIQEFLARQFLFVSLDENQVELITHAASIRSIKKSELLFSEGQTATAFFIVVSGSVKIYKLSAEGSEQILHVQQPGDLVAEGIIFEFDLYPAFCEALEDSVLIRLAKSQFLELLRHCPDITFKMMSAYSRRLRQLILKIEELSLHDVKSRLATYFINNAEFENNKHIVPIKFAKKDLAAILGTIPETLSRMLTLFKKEKIIVEAQGKIIIEDMKKLNSISKQM